MNVARRLVALFRAVSTQAMSPTPWTPNRYPPTRRSDHVDVYESEAHGQVRVPDPYQWLESNTEETEQWVTNQEAFTRTYLDQNPHRQRLEDQIRSNMNYAKVRSRKVMPDRNHGPRSQFSAPGLSHDRRWYWYYNSGLQAQSGPP
jgi:prolyl oligopeptidase